MSCNRFLRNLQKTRQHELQGMYERSLYPAENIECAQDQLEQEEQVEVFFPSWQDVYDLYSESYIQ